MTTGRRASNGQLGGLQSLRGMKTSLMEGATADQEIIVRSILTHRGSESANSSKKR